MKEFFKKYKILIILLVFFTALTPLAFLVAERLNFGSAWGEWGSEELQKMFGFAPEGLKRHEAIFGKAPMPDYSLPEGIKIPKSIAYLLSGVVGVFLLLLIFYLVSKMISRSETK